MCLLLYQVIVSRLSKIVLVGFLAVARVHYMATQNGCACVVTLLMHNLNTYMLSIHNNLSAGTQNVTGAYLLTTHLHGKAAV